jgi:SAM-dependent methyltransferase
MSAEDRRRWDAKYSSRVLPDAAVPDAFLVEQTSSLAPRRALDLACGLGQNALWLCRQGWQVDAIDISLAGLALAAQFARQNAQQVNWLAADLDEFVLPTDTYALITVFRFLDRRRLPALIEQALEPGGLLVYETFTNAELQRPGTHLVSAAWTLRPGELPTLFPRLEVLTCREFESPEKCVAQLAARRGGRFARLQ